MVLAWIAAMGLCAAPLAAATAARSGVVVDGHARFTVITPTLIRMEYSRDGKFINRRSYFAWERNVPPPQFTSTHADGVLKIATARMKLTWKGGTGFEAQNLSVAFLNGDGQWTAWHPGMKQTGNLGGTLADLDGCTGAQPLPDGAVSRNGWYLHRDKSFLVSDGPNPWRQTRPADEVDDWYFFGYGKDNYHAALADLTAISGRIPIPPRFMLGSWRSRFKNYTQHQFQQMVLNYDAEKFPLDVLVMDMGWHTPPHWGSMDWNKKLIPHPTQLLQWLHQRDLHVTVNWHPQDGVGPWYSQYDEFCKAIGVNPAAKKVLPFDDTNQKFMRNYFRLMMDPMEKQGIDFWWLDGGVHVGWDNALDFWNIERPGTGKRGASFSRWGGWGDQRYPVSFSGDTSSLWRVLRFEIPYTATGGNVGADYWSNDVSGFRLKIPTSELFTRWAQFGVLSPVFRTHGTIQFGDFRYPWAYGAQAVSATRRAYDLRAQLLPYIYTSSYLTWKTSLPLVRPLYLDYPKNAEAYDHRDEYEFGPDLLAAPIVTRGMGKAWLGATDMWFPGGSWWNLLNNERVNQAGDRTMLASAGEIPVFVRGGVPLPMQPVRPRPAAQPANPLVVRVYPGQNGSFTLYEDDGTSSDYLHGAYALTPLHYQNRGAQGVQVTVDPAKGSYAGQPAARRIVVELPVTAHPATVTVNGTNVPESPTALPGYIYHPVSATTEIRLPAESIRTQVAVDVTFRGSPSVQAMIPQIVNQIAVVQRALAGAGQMRAMWKYRLVDLRFDLRTLLSRAEQELGPASAADLQSGFASAQKEESAIQVNLQQYSNHQARAAAFALNDAYVSASVRLRKAGEGLMTQNTPRFRKHYGQPNDIRGYNAGLLVRALTPAGAAGKSLAIDIPGLADRSFPLPAARQRMYLYLPFSKGTQRPLYNFRGSAKLTLTDGASQRVLTRSIHVSHELLTQWSFAGPFAPGKAPEVGGQPVTAAILHRKYTGLHGKPVAWKTWLQVRAKQFYGNSGDYMETGKRWIDMHSIYPDFNASAVAVTWVEAPEAVTLQLRARHNAGIQVWLNQASVLHAAGEQGAKNELDPTPEVVTVHLRKGWNQLAIRTDGGSSQWTFGLWLKLPHGLVLAQSSTPPASGTMQ